jgi:hypothetical protein
MDLILSILFYQRLKLEKEDLLKMILMSVNINSKIELFFFEILI